jgi:Fe2+ or Zn2+ uptake regulation protein
LASGPDIKVRPRNWLTPVAIVLLREERSYGYQLMERLATDFDFEQVNAGTLYRTLRQMEKEGLCESEWETSKVGCTTSPKPAKPILTCGSKRLMNIGE